MLSQQGIFYASHIFFMVYNMRKNKIGERLGVFCKIYKILFLYFLSRVGLSNICYTEPQKFLNTSLGVFHPNGRIGKLL